MFTGPASGLCQHSVGGLRRPSVKGSEGMRSKDISNEKKIGRTLREQRIKDQSVRNQSTLAGLNPLFDHLSERGDDHLRGVHYGGADHGDVQSLHYHSTGHFAAHAWPRGAEAVIKPAFGTCSSPRSCHTRRAWRPDPALQGYHDLDGHPQDDAPWKSRSCPQARSVVRLGRSNPYRLGLLLASSISPAHFARVGARLYLWLLLR